jgi:CRISPR/Cas system CSM-associated protein Csm3 (group 7 of RAMP superfamily)
MKLESIWQLEGTLETVTPLHIGDGGVRYGKFRRSANNPDGEVEEASEIQTAAKRLDNKARIPGSALKGVLRSGFAVEDAGVRQVFGFQEEEPAIGQGGSVQFLDAVSEQPLSWAQLVLGRTAIDPVSGAAQDRFLFHLELVPEETRFQVRIRGKAFAGELWQDAVALVDSMLRRFNDESITLGSGESNHWGVCRWRLDAVRVLDAAERGKWLAAPKPLDSALGKLPDRKSELNAVTPVAETRANTIHLQLRFDGHSFLVNDPRKTGKKEPGKDVHAHAARRTADGKLLLPAESFRGVLAHQAARIARTKGKAGQRQPVKRDSSGALTANLDSVTRLFGAAGWASVIQVRDFVEISRTGQPFPLPPQTHEFLAVDRFTGGGAEERKFDAEGGWQPWLAGRVTIDLKRLSATGKPEPALGLLALTLRDLAEGDLSFGWGSSKGFGWATVDTGDLDAAQWVESSMAGWCSGSVTDWIREWEKENHNG